MNFRLPTMSDSPHDIACSEPSDFVFGELSKELGKLFDTKQ